MLQTVDWNHYLSRQNPWTGRLLGWEPFTKTRDAQQIEREYNQDKYGSLLPLNLATVAEYSQVQFESVGFAADHVIPVAFGEELVEMPWQIARNLQHSLVTKVIRDFNPARICELGCGYGLNFPVLLDITAEVYGGEYSQNAVTIAQRLGLDIHLFDYYKPDSYDLIRDRTLIFTSHSVEQLPSAQVLLDNLSRHRDKIDKVVHFEPTFLAERNTLVGCLRNRYIEINDYNRDLVTLLKARTDIEILSFQPDLIGLNPLNSTCVIVWQFC